MAPNLPHSACQSDVGHLRAHEGSARCQPNRQKADCDCAGKQKDTKLPHVAPPQKYIGGGIFATANINKLTIVTKLSRRSPYRRAEPIANL